MFGFVAQITDGTKSPVTCCAIQNSDRDAPGYLPACCEGNFQQQTYVRNEQGHVLRRTSLFSQGITFPTA